jgi:hypothetical protein
LLSVLLTGTLNQMKADGLWFAVKEAAISDAVCGAVLFSMRTKRPLVRELSVERPDHRHRRAWKLRWWNATAARSRSAAHAGQLRARVFLSAQRRAEFRTRALPA